MTQTDLRAQCAQCTVPVSGEKVCAFCQSYTPPETTAQKIDVLVNRVDLLRADGNTLLGELSPTAPLFAVADVVTALGHLRRAAVAFDRASDALETDAEAVR